MKIRRTHLKSESPSKHLFSRESLLPAVGKPPLYISI
nr:MAG TPA: hypothetical protein [Caudoviricetes sp.]